jgi:Na+-transporting NADH:ubiquinone oxidoreductase subunit NqrF
MQYISLIGKASGENKLLKIEDEDLNITVLQYLQKHNIPIASSCGGKRACETCTINGDQLSCAINLDSFISKHGKVIEIDYI